MIRALLTLLAICVPMLAQAQTQSQTVAPTDARPPLIAESQRFQWQSIGQVAVGGFKSRGLCTGTLIAPDKVLTAAHCVIDRKTGEAFPNYRVTFIAGLYKGEMLGSSGARAIRAHPEFKTWTLQAGQRVKPNHLSRDLAVIELAEPLDQVTPATLANLPAEPGPVAVLGYRLDRRYVLTDYLGCQAAVATPELLALSCDVVQGSSGAPVFAQIDGEYRLVGVVAARNESKSEIKGLAVRVDDAALPAFVYDGAVSPRPLPRASLPPLTPEGSDTAPVQN